MSEYGPHLRAVYAPAAGEPSSRGAVDGVTPPRGRGGSGRFLTERRLPQDGRVGLTIDGRHVDVRVVTLPSVHGESDVLRILDKESIRLELEELGMQQHELERFRRSFRRAHGAVLATGPTGRASRRPCPARCSS
jgi:Type II/IV secretion system protein